MDRPTDTAELPTGYMRFWSKASELGNAIAQGIFLSLENWRFFPAAGLLPDAFKVVNDGTATS